MRVARVCVCVVHTSIDSRRTGESGLISGAVHTRRVHGGDSLICTAAEHAYIRTHAYTHTRTRKGYVFFLLFFFYIRRKKEFIATVVISCLSLNWSVFLFLIFILPSSA